MASRGQQGDDPITMVLGAAAILAVIAGASWLKCSCDDWTKEYEAKQRRQEQDLAAATERANQERLAARRAKAAAEEDARRREAARTPEERAQTALNNLAEAGDLVSTVCDARRTLEPIPKERRREPALAKAFASLKSKEAQALVLVRKEAEETRGIVCADGSGSGCRCKGPHRGCCSHHRGIAGCEPLPTEITCPDAPAMR